MKHLSNVNDTYSREMIILIIGDGLTLLITTLIGFASHASSLSGGRWLTTFLPLAVSWGIAAPWLGVFQKDLYSKPSEILWRTLLAVVLSAPLAALLRALMLGSVVIPVFVLVLAATAGLAMILWRFFFILVFTRRHVN